MRVLLGFAQFPNGVGDKNSLCSFFSNLQKCNLEKFLRLVLLDLVAVFIFLIKFQMKFYQKKYQLLQKKLSKNKIKKWNSMWRLKKFSEGARRNFEKFFNTTLNCCIKKHQREKGRSPFAHRRVITKFDGGIGGTF